ncbi:MAG: hypothetical protein ACJASX_001799 [Limisphaerales bacterium]|jgi:hypothetical protein
MNEAVKQKAFPPVFSPSNSLLEGLGRVGVFDGGTFKLHRNFIERGLI